MCDLDNWFQCDGLYMCSRIDLLLSEVFHMKPLHVATTSTTHYLLYTSSKQRNKYINLVSLLSIYIYISYIISGLEVHPA